MDRNGVPDPVDVSGEQAEIEVVDEKGSHREGDLKEPKAKDKKKQKQAPPKKKQAAVEEKGNNVEPAVPANGEAYAPKVFQQVKKRFVNELREAEKISYPDAVRKWMLSEARANFLAQLDEKELKRRRFA